MNYVMKSKGNNVTLLEWVEPEVRQLDVRETAQTNIQGGDGGLGSPNGDDTAS